MTRPYVRLDKNDVTVLLVDHQAGLLSLVRDFEPDAFKSLALHAQALFPDHLEALGEPGLPFAEMESQSGEFRGKPVRLRGEIVDAREIIRFPGGSPEYWCTIRTEDGDLFFFASLRVPEELFLSENFVLADGLLNRSPAIKQYLNKIPQPWPDQDTPITQTVVDSVNLVELCCQIL